MIRARNLTYGYGDGVVAVDDVSLSIDDGEFLLLAGPNGSGKTTRTAVGMVFQDPRDGFVAATVGADVAFGPENLGLTHDEIDRRVDDALAAVRLREKRDARIEALSGGERERVAIAGALAMEPDHLVLDEPFTGLDWPARRAVLARLDALHASGTSVVVVTHDLRDVAALADRVVVLTQGRIALDAPPDGIDPDRLTERGIRPP